MADGSFIDFNVDNDYTGFETPQMISDQDTSGLQPWQMSLEGGSAWQNVGSGLFDYGMSQSRLADLWNQTQGNEYAGAYDAMGQLSNTNKLLNNNDNWFVSKGADGKYGLTPHMKHGYMNEFLTAVSFMMPALSEIFMGAGAAGAGGTEAAAAGAGEVAMDMSYDQLMGNTINSMNTVDFGAGMQGAGYSGFDSALSGFGSAGAGFDPAGFNEEGLNNYKTPDTVSGGGIGGSGQGTQLMGGEGNPDKAQTQLQRDFLKYAGNEIKPGLGNAVAVGDKAMSDGQGLWGTDLTAKDLVTGLTSLYGMSQMNKNLGRTVGNLQNMYGQNSPYAEELRNRLMRRDAAAGRRSQYGPREVELQAKLAEQYSRNAPALMQGQNQQAANRMGMVTNLAGLGMKALPALQRLWTTDSAPTGDQMGSMGMGYDFGSQAPGYGFGMDQSFGSYGNTFGTDNLDFSNYTNNPYSLFGG